MYMFATNSCVQKRVQVHAGRRVFLIGFFCSVSLLVTPWGDFLAVEKVTKDTHRERVFRLPLSL